MIQLESIEHDYISSLKCQSYKQMSTQSRKDSVGLGIKGYERPRFYSLGVTFSHWIFLFSCIKLYGANIDIVGNFV